MDRIEVRVLNPFILHNVEKTMVAAARLTQSGHKVKTMDDLVDLLNKPFTDETIEHMSSLPHPTIQKFGVLNVAIVGASRRFLAQITRHQNEVKFMSASLQYSDYSDDAQFVVPYEFIEADCKNRKEFFVPQYIASCKHSMNDYKEAVSFGFDRDSAGYMAPQGLRNVLIISATPYQWKHMISQRICNRNTAETQYVMLCCWEEFIKLSALFNYDIGPACLMYSKCNEGKMSCKHFLYDADVGDIIIEKDCSLPAAILDSKFKYIRCKK